jgi:hypothetical protein
MTVKRWHCYNMKINSSLRKNFIWKKIYQNKNETKLFYNKNYEYEKFVWIWFYWPEQSSTIKKLLKRKNLVLDWKYLFRNKIENLMKRYRNRKQIYWYQKEANKLQFKNSETNWKWFFFLAMLSILKWNELFWFRKSGTIKTDWFWGNWRRIEFCLKRDI